MSKSLDENLYGLTNEISRGNFADALEFGKAALASEELQAQPSLRASVLRNISAAHDRLGNSQEALGNITEAYEIHDQLARATGPASEQLGAIYERAATASYVGMYGLKAAILSESEADAVKLKAEALAMSRQAQGDIGMYKDATSPGRPPQYEINMLPRWSMIESLAGGDKHLGRLLAQEAIWAARLSEKVDGPKKGLTKRDVLRARIRASVRGFGAAAVNALSRFKATEPAAEKLALKLL